MKSLCLVLMLQLGFATVASAQRMERSAFRTTLPQPSPHIALDIPRAPADVTRPPVSRGDMTMQVLSGGAGGLLGAFVAFLPLAATTFGGNSKISDNAAVTAVILGYYAGTAVGVQTYSRAIGLQGSWKATFLGAAIGVLGGPAVLVTMPIGATIGFNRTRRLRQ